MKWIKCGEEQKGAFENSLEMTGGFLRQLKGRRWNVIRKIRVIRLIRRVIEEGIIGGGVKGMYEEGCRILEEISRGRGREEEEEEEEGEEEERYMYELWLLKVRGEWKKMKEDEISGLRREVEELGREVEEEKRKREEAEKGREEEKKRAEEERRMKEEEKRMRAEVERLRDEEKRKREESEGEKRKMEEEMKKLKEDVERWKRNMGTITSLNTSLDGIGVEFGDVSVMRKENNSIIHNNEKIGVSGFVGGKLDNSVHRMFE